MRALPGFLAAILAAGLLAAGCGDDDDGEVGRDEFVGEAKAICGEAQADAVRLAQRAQREATANPQQLDRILRELFSGELVSILRQTVDRIGELDPPEGQGETLEEFVRDSNAAFDEIAANPQRFVERALRGDAGETPFPELQRQAAELGIENCLQLTP